ncbi:MAG: zf-HC2 domain-containing protein [bacterium]
MTDCPDANARDLLPAFVHGRLDAGTRATVEAHLASCDDCRAEVALLRELRGVVGGAPRMDVRAIVAALPASRAPARRSWTRWRAAAAIVVLVAGGATVALRHRHDAPAPAVAVAANPSVVAPAVAPQPSPQGEPESAVAAATAPRAPAPTSSTTSTTAPVLRIASAVTGERELAMGGDAINDLNDRELATLLKDIESLDAVPSVEVDNVPLAPIAPSAPAGAVR